MKITLSSIDGVFMVDTEPVRDERGSFTRWFCDREMAPVLGHRTLSQINHSCTQTVGAVRGLHFQHPPHAEMKWIRCTRGRVWDLVVDLRRGSSTFLRWHGEELSADNGLMVVVPEGCAHGFQVLEEGSEMLYLHTAPYVPSAEGGVLYNDLRLGIRWPLPVTDLSPRDRNHPPLAPDFPGLVR